MFNFKLYNWKRLNVSLVIVVILLGILSVYFVKCAGNNNLQAMSFLKKQLVGVIVGLFIMAFVCILDYHFICRFVVVFYALATILVAATKLPPFGTDMGTGCARWVDFKIITIQPTELAKIAIILALATFYTKYQEEVDKMYVHVLAGGIVAIPTFFIYKQPNLSSTLVMLFIFAMMFFASGISYKKLGVIFSVAAPVLLGLFWYIQQPGQKLLTHYQFNRIMHFKNPGGEELGAIYQQIRSIESIASGKVYGKMLSDNVTSAKGYLRVPVNESDFIFSIIGEELGLIGSCAVLALLAVVVIKCLLTAKKAKDFTGQLIAIGIASMIMFQIFANIGVATKILPNTGLPLPFISYGSSSMVGNMISIGLILNIGIQSSRSRY